MSDADKQLHIRSTNHPGLLFVTNEDSDDILRADDLLFDDQLWDGYSYDNFDTKTTAELKALISENFKNHTLGDGSESGFLLSPFPTMNEAILASTSFRWRSDSQPYATEQGAACRAYKAMSEENWKCTMPAGGSDRKPSAPPTFKVMIDK